MLRPVGQTTTPAMTAFTQGKDITDRSPQEPASRPATVLCTAVATRVLNGLWLYLRLSAHTDGQTHM
jgi:hypothetical protein